MVATPVLAGALLRIVMGILVDRLSPKKAAIIGQVIVIAAHGLRLAGGVHSQLRTNVLILGLFPRRCRCFVCRRAAAGLALVSGGASGHGFGHCRGRQLRHGAGRIDCAQPGRGLWLDQRLRHFADAAGSIVSWLYSGAGQGCAGMRRRRSALAEYLKVLKDKDAWWFMFFYSVTFRRICRVLPHRWSSTSIRNTALMRRWPAFSPLPVSSPVRWYGPSAAMWPTASAASGVAD
jgi:NNP family nitrate/nitrite transporter-like MFS transporter